MIVAASSTAQVGRLVKILVYTATLHIQPHTQHLRYGPLRVAIRAGPSAFNLVSLLCAPSEGCTAPICPPPAHQMRRVSHRRSGWRAARVYRGDHRQLAWRPPTCVGRRIRAGRHWLSAAAPATIACDSLRARCASVRARFRVEHMRLRMLARSALVGAGDWHAGFLCSASETVGMGVLLAWRLEFQWRSAWVAATVVCMVYRGILYARVHLGGICGTTAGSYCSHVPALVLHGLIMIVDVGAAQSGAVVTM